MVLKNSFLVFALIFTKSGKSSALKKVLRLKFIVLKNYLAQIAENFISVRRVHVRKNKKQLVITLIGC
jgi:hypothetical protein